ncbi:MAG: ice-binding family protein [Jatrophihabitans sp.]
MTLDGQGSLNSVFIFQVAKTLITASASHVRVINGAQACHVFWQVGSSATLGTASPFIGTIMALQSISVTTATTVQRRALARNGQVSLDDNVFTMPACDTTTPKKTTTTVTASPKASTTGGTVTLTAAVSGAGGTPTGTVTFREGTKVLGTVALNSTGHATLKVPAGTAGTRKITATYNGYLHFVASSSAARSITVAARPRSGSATTPVSGGGTGLAATGAKDLGGIAGVGGGMFVAGLTLIWAAARRNKPRHLH